MVAKKKTLRVVKKAPVSKVERRNAMLKQRVQAFTKDLQLAIAKFGVKSEDLTVTVHLQIKDPGPKQR